MTTKYHLFPVARSARTTEVRAGFGTETIWLYCPGVVPANTRNPVSPVNGLPSVLVVGARHDTVTERVGFAVTEIAKAGIEAEALPSLTRMTILAKAPLVVGVP